MTRPGLRALLQKADDAALRECAQRWGVDTGCGGRDGWLAGAIAGMEDERRVRERIDALPRRLQDLLETFFRDEGSVRTLPALFADVGRAWKSRFELEAALAALQREALLFPAADRRWTEFDAPAWAVPGELVECVLGGRRRRQRAVGDVLTLQGWLDARHFRERKDDGDARASERAAEHARKIYKLYALPASIDSRLQKLPAHVRAVVDMALQRHGGLVAWCDLLQEFDAEDLPDPELCRKVLEERLLGTVGALDLARHGLQPVDQGLFVFHEVALHALRQHGLAHAPAVGEVLACGGDLPSNVGRFLRELQQSKVLFTADGDLFRASQKRIAGLLLPVPGGVLNGEQLLELLYRFCLHRRLIDRRGERGLRPTPAGLEFDRAALPEQARQLLSWFVEDRSLPGEAFHQVRMRRVVLRLLKRAEPMRWQEITILPFLARNAWLAQLDGAQAEEFFAARFQGGGYTPTEGLQQMGWNLLLWIKKRLFPLGIVDIGLVGGKPGALRLSQFGAELLEADPAARVGGTRSTLIVNPDFEVLVFPGDDVHEVVHALDRFARRTKSDHVHQFALSRESVRAGLQDGLDLRQILQDLTDRAKVPIPQNVLYSLEEWAGRG